MDSSNDPNLQETNERKRECERKKKKKKKGGTVVALEECSGV